MNLEDICGNFFNDNKSLSTSVLISFQKQATNVKNVNKVQFINYVLNSTEFQEHYHKMFETVYNAMFGRKYVDRIQDLKHKFVTQYIRTKNRLELNDVVYFLMSQDVFESHYRDLVKNIYSFYFSNDITPDQYSYVLDKMKTIDFLKPVKEIESELKKIVSSLTCNTVSEETMEDNIDSYKGYYIERYETKFHKQPTIAEISEFTDFLNNKHNITDLYMHLKYKDYSNFFNNITDHFQYVFDRDITLFEYVRYHDVFMKENSIEMYYANFNNKFIIITNVYNDFLPTVTMSRLRYND